MSQLDRELADRFWSATPLRALWPFLLGVGCTFGAVGFLVDVANGGRLPAPALAALTVFSGLVAVSFALIAIRRRFWLLLPVIALQVLVPEGLQRLWPDSTLVLSQAALRSRLTASAAGALVGLVLGYVFFMVFIVGQGIRRVRAEAEMALARDIHAALVPTVSLATDRCEMFGRSIPASEVGGDLVDGLALDRGALGFVADVSGHGVPAGTLMGLLKASLRTRLRGSPDPAAILSDLNDVLFDLTPTNRFATAALLLLETPGRLTYTLAGHPPILHLRRRDLTVARLADGGLALGIRPGERYAVAQVSVAPGDLLAVLTDGFMETTDLQDRELGLEPIESALVAHAERPLPELFERLLELTVHHGRQEDDRSLLLVRIC